MASKYIRECVYIVHLDGNTQKQQWWKSDMSGFKSKQQTLFFFFLPKWPLGGSALQKVSLKVLKSVYPSRRSFCSIEVFCLLSCLLSSRDTFLILNMYYFLLFKMEMVGFFLTHFDNFSAKQVHSLLMDIMLRQSFQDKYVIICSGQINGNIACLHGY